MVLGNHVFVSRKSKASSSRLTAGTSSGEPRGGKHSWLAEKVPKTKKTSNRDENSAAENSRQMFMSVIDDCLADTGNITAAFNSISKRKSDLVVGLEEVDSAERFQKLSTVERLETLFVMNFIEEFTDMSNKDICRYMGTVPEGHIMIFVRLVEWPLSMKLPSTCWVKSVLRNLAARRVAELHCGKDYMIAGLASPKMALRQHQHITTGDIDWLKAGAYQMEYSNTNLLATITHRRSHRTYDATALKMEKKSMKFVSNESDFTASVQQSPYPAITVAELFKQQGDKDNSVGPFLGTFFCSGNCKKMNEMADREYDNWKVGRAQARSGSTLPAEYVALQKMKTESRMKSATTKRLEQVEAKRARKVVKLDG